MIKTSKRLGKVKEYYFSSKLREIAQMRRKGHDVINLGIGSPDLPPPPAVIEELHHQSSKPNVHAYQSYQGIPELRSAFAAWYKNHFEVDLDPTSEILPLIGSKEGIMHISMTYLDEGDEVLVPNPGYPAYSAVAKLTGATQRTYSLEASQNWLPDLKALAKQDLSKVKIMWVNYPNMPTGAKATSSFFEELVAFARAHRILICNDNPYAFILNNNPLSILSVDGAKEVALELNSLSKAHNMAGWRVGMIAGHQEYLQNIIRFKSNMDSGMFKPVQLAAVKALHISKDWYADLNQEYRKRRDLVFQLLDLLNCKYDPDQSGLFVWAKIQGKGQNGFELSDELLQKFHLFITPGGIFGDQGAEYIRVSLCNTQAILRTAIQRIKNNQKL